MNKRFFSILAISSLLAITGCGGGGGTASCTLENPTCEEGFYCKLLDGTCGADGAPGECVALPPPCTNEVAPVCTCDNVSFFNACFAGQSRQSIRSGGDCA